MKRTLFATFFVVTHVFFIFLELHKHNQCITQSFTNQKDKQELQKLSAHKQQLLHQLHALKDPQDIKLFAQTKLAMQPVRLHHVKKLPAATV